MNFPKVLRDKIFLIAFLIAPWTLPDKAGAESAPPGKGRAEIVRAYAAEFSSQAFLTRYPKIYAAIEEVLRKIPRGAFLFITRRECPVLFTEVYPEGQARLANSSAIQVLPDDPPTFTKGIWLVKLSAELEESEETEAIQGIIAHEIAHRVLDRWSRGKTAVQKEKAANHLICAWGLKKEFLASKSRWGTGGNERKKII